MRKNRQILWANLCGEGIASLVGICGGTTFLRASRCLADQRGQAPDVVLLRGYQLLDRGA
jgi:hypothetical protein